jgi:excisionase family DNA binding protein
LLTVAQAAKELGMDVSSVHRAIRDRRLPATKLGPNATMIKREDVEAYKATPKHGGGRPRKEAETAPDPR